jgi:dTDP-4-dehydrorhamnose 3,5-epimerase
MSFEFIRKEIGDIILIKPKVFKDERGYFFETYRESDYKDFGIQEKFIQFNHSHSIEGVLRGLHYQLPPSSQGKLIRCVRGQIFDVSVDIRKGSETFGKWVSLILSEQNRYICYIPPGFAHGYFTMSDKADVLYSVTAVYSPESERGIVWNDPTLNISWPDKHVIVSERDRCHPSFEEAELFS